MTARLSAKFYQPAAGQPIQVRAILDMDMDGWEAVDDFNLGVMTSAAVPTSKSSFAHVETATSDLSENITHNWLRDTGLFKQSVTYILQTAQALDANYAAGRYLWYWSSLADDTIQALSKPYRIR